MKISPFQIIVLALFAVFTIGGLIVLATSKSKTTGSGIPVVIWGTISSQTFTDTTADLIQGNSGLQFNYVQKRAETFDRDLIEAIASGVGPDVILFPENLITRLRDKIAPLSYNSFPLRTFKDTFIDEGELFLDSAGALALPFTVDPMVMYWNRDLLSNANIVLPPATWDEFITLVPKLTVSDKNQNILRSAVALGEYRNITNAKEIISALFLQSGNPIMTMGQYGLKSVLAPATIQTIGAMNFYTDFANPVKPDYSWNRVLRSSKNAFIAGNLAFYFGFVSELADIRQKNPNLNFDVSYFPQPKGGANLVTFGRMLGLAVLKSAKNSDSYTNVLALIGQAPLARLAASTGLPPVRRDMLKANPSDPYQIIFYNSAIRARSWLDPNPQESSRIFQDMIESITGGALEVGSAVELAGRNLNSI